MHSCYTISKGTDSLNHNNKEIMFFKTIDSVITDFTKAVDNLNKLAATYAKQADDASEKSAEFLTISNKARQEETRATKLAANINKLLS